MGDSRNIQILEHKISDMEKKIKNFKERNISLKKIEKLKIMKLKYENELDEIKYK